MKFVKIDEESALILLSIIYFKFIKIREKGIFL